ncbi:MAG TPA: neprosin family prolyl endopeptidase [Polyangiaceae bacterium]|nr:neprosin family prolyl endopeptidase [Polyangiaceae bacterium]
MSAVGQTHEQLQATTFHAVLGSRYSSSDVRHSFKTKFGETIDCIDFFAQPGVKRLAALGHPITELPRTEPVDNGSIPDDLFNGKPDENGAPRACPEGTVPKVRAAAGASRAAGAATINSVVAKRHLSPPASCPLTPELTNYAHAIQNYPAPNAPSVHIVSGTASLSINKPLVPTTPIYDHSLAQVWLTAGCGFNLAGRTCQGADCIESVEVGWDVDPTYVFASTKNPANPHLFIFSTNDGYTTGCYDNDTDHDLETCDDRWVANPHAVMAPAMELSPSVLGGTQTELALSVVFETPSWSNSPGWVVRAGTTGAANVTDVGYYPAADFQNQMQSSADAFQVGGEIADETNGMVVPIGSGASAQSGFGRAAFVHDFEADTTESGWTQSFYDTGVTIPAGDPVNYTISTTTAPKPGGNWQNYFYYGDLELQSKLVISHQALLAIQAFANGSRTTTSSIVVGENGAVYSRSVQGGAWGNPTAISATNIAPAGAGVATGALSSTQTGVFLVGNNGSVYVTTQTNGGAWSAPSTLTAANFAKPGALLSTGTPAGQLTVFVVDTAGKLESIAYNPSTGWAAPVARTAANFAPSGAPLAVGTRANGELDVFAVGSDGALKYIFYNIGIWGGPLSLTSAAFAPTGAPVAAALDVHGYLNVLVVGNTGALYTDWDVTPAWSGATAVTALGFAPPGAGVSAINFNNQSLNAFVVDNNGTVNALSNSGTAWQGPTGIATYATVPGAPVSTVLQGTNELDVFTSAPGAPNGVIESIDTGGAWSTVAL